MQLSREGLLRMFGDAGGSGAGGGGGMNIAQMEAMLSGYATEDWVDKNYLSIDFFSALFKAYDSNGDQVTPNGGNTATIDNIKAMFGFWTNQYISALGRNSSGGGGGGDILTEPLSTINSSALGTPTGQNKVIMWDGSAWGYATLTGNTGTVTSVGLAPSNGSHLAVSGSPITTSGTMYVSVESGYSIPTDVRQANWDAAYTNSHTHTNKAVLDGITSTQVTNWDDAVTALTTLATRVGTLEGYFTNGNANNALRLTTTSKTLWGNTYWTSGGVPKSVGTSSSRASLSYVTNINMAGTITGVRAIEMNTDGGLTSIGGHIDFHYNGGGSDFTSRVVETSAGVISILARTNDSSNTLTDAGFEIGAGYDGSYIRIGNVYLSYNETNNALVVSANADGTGTANIYAIGGVSALGYGASGGGGTVSALTDLVDVSISSPINGQALVYDNNLGKWKNGAVTTGTVTSVALTMPTGFSVSGSPITSNGTFAINFGGSVSANRVLASPNGSAGSPSWRSLVANDIPDLSGTYATPASVATQMQNYAYISGSTIHIGSSSITPLTSHQSVSGTFWGQSWENGRTITGNINAGSNGGVISAFHGIELNSAGSLSNNGGFIDFHFNGSSSDFTSRIIELSSGTLTIMSNLYMDNTRTFQIGNGTVKWSDGILKFGSLNTTISPATDVGGFRDVYINNNGVIRFYDNPSHDNLTSVSTGLSVITLNDRNEFALGYGLMTTSSDSTRRVTRFQGGRFEMQVGYNDGLSTSSSIHATTAFTIGKNTISGNDVDGICKVHQGLLIGNALLRWDSINNALYVSKADGSSANFYALGGVSALGIGTNADTNLTTLTVGTLSVTSALNSGTSTWLKMTQMCSNSGSSYWQIKTDGSAKFTDLEITGIGGKIQSYLVKANEITANKFYLDNTRYLYLSTDSTPKLMYYNGTTSKEVAFV